MDQKGPQMKWVAVFFFILLYAAHRSIETGHPIYAWLCYCLAVVSVIVSTSGCLQDEHNLTRDE